MQYKVSSTKVPMSEWFATRELAIAAFERECKQARVRIPSHYPPRVSGDGYQHSHRVYPKWTRASGTRDGHGYVFVESRSDTD